MSEPFIGEVRMFAGNFAPRGWALCDGQILAIQENSALFALVGTLYGGDGRTTFALPDLRGRAPMHAGSGAGLTTRSLGDRAGAEEVALSVEELPAHAHDVSCSGSSGTCQTPVGHVPAEQPDRAYVPEGSEQMASTTILETGGGEGHDNVQPSLVLNFIIAVEGTFPSRS